MKAHIQNRKCMLLHCSLSTSERYRAKQLVNIAFISAKYTYTVKNAFVLLPQTTQSCDDKRVIG